MGARVVNDLAARAYGRDGVVHDECGLMLLLTLLVAEYRRVGRFRRRGQVVHQVVVAACRGRRREKR